MNSLYYSELGGPDSYFRKLMLVNGFLFLIINRSFYKKFFLFSLIPILFVLMSLLFNIRSVTVGSINSTFFTILGILLLTVKPLSVDKKFMKRLIVICLIVSVITSLFALYSAIKSLELITGFSNFNINPNQAGIFFYSCITVAIYFIKSWRKYFIILPNYFLILATGSRAAFFCSSILIIFSEIFIDRVDSTEFIKKKILSILKSLVVIVTLFFSILYQLKDYFAFLFERLEKVGVSTESAKGEGRDLIWENVFNLINKSPTAWIFGFGPSSIDSMIGDKSTHNSFIDAIATKGAPYLLFTLVYLFLLAKFHKKYCHLFVIFSIINILIYGFTVSDLFGGIGSLWGLVIFLSLWVRSISVDSVKISSV